MGNNEQALTLTKVRFCGILDYADKGKLREIVGHKATGPKLAIVTRNSKEAMKSG